MDTQLANLTFIEKLAMQDERDKLAQVGGRFIRDRLREVSFCRKVIPFEPVKPSDLQVSVNHDTLVMIREVEPRSRAMAITFRGQPTVRYIRAPRYEIPFFTITSEQYEKVEQELLAYKMPITKIIEENTVKDIQAIEDREFLLHVESAVQAVQEAGNKASGSLLGFNASNLQAGNVESVSIVKGEGARARTKDDFVKQPLQWNDIIDLCNVLGNTYLKAERILMSEIDWNDISRITIEEFGHELRSEIAVKGYKYDQIWGKKVIRTIKTDILRPGNIYAFTAPEYFGDAYVLNDTKFWIEKRVNIITWQAWEDIGMGIGNIRSVAKLELYSGSVTPGATDTGYTSKIPVSEEELDFVNNKVDEGLYFPQVQSF